ncbi:hypothetical protein LCGC14_1860340 [marine sediment metagenome]|uniref:Uncharacterized protein n=1 Tax=marine sediment metagenome TaxID=412755 RepID=A0A0F9J6T0_9ZZZZ
MKWTEVAENWPAFFERIEDKWPAVSQTDLIDIDGDRDRLAYYLADRHEITLGEANEQIDEFLLGSIPADVLMDEHHDNASITASGRHIPPGEDVYAEDRDFGDDNVSNPPVGRSGLD